MPRGSSVQRLEANARTLRALVDAGSSRVVRGEVGTSAPPGARRKHPLPCIGYSFGKLTLTGYLLGPRNGVTHAIVRCRCGRPEYAVSMESFTALRSGRCDVCAKEATRQKKWWKYGHVMPDDAHRTRLLNRLSAAISRCHSKSNSQYANYGRRGIVVHPPWRANKATFLEYVQTIPGWDSPELEMDRTDVNGNYEPGNIRFVSRKENAANKRRIEDLEEELARLRHLVSRTTPPVHCPNCGWTPDSS